MKEDILKTLASNIGSISVDEIKTDKDILSILYPSFRDVLENIDDFEVKKVIEKINTNIKNILEENPYLEDVLRNARAHIILSLFSKFNFIPLLENILKDTKDFIPDIPIQNKQANDSGVPREYNATVGMLIGEDSKVIVSPNIEKSLKNYKVSSENISDIVSYHPGEGKEIFRKSLQELIKEEEKRYAWIDKNTKNRKGVSLTPFFIPGGAGGLTLSRDYFLREGDLAIVPNKRWPNIDGILSQATKLPVAITEIYKDNGEVDFSSLDHMLKIAEKQARDRVFIYLNPVCNPTGTTFSPRDSKRLNTILNKYSDISITLVIDDPYGVFATNNKKNVITPLSYFIDTDKNVTILEMGSRGTKEGGIYGLRSASMRVFTSEEKKEKLELKIKKAIRQTFSMSPSFPQDIYVQALFSENNMEKIEKLSQKEKKERIGNYLDGREKLIGEVQARRESLSKEIFGNCSEYLEEIQNISGEESYTGGFFIGYNLSSKLISKGVVAEDIRKACISFGENGCAITVINNIIRIVLIPEKYHREFVSRLKNAIEKTLK